ncbi:hypothetical protein HOLleu_05468 [Holothuria leucospilota]|uniref:Uncharacterized protein n=1 Tax=Holothuria leucospilota TaxID=206669 RepID=A0A9Q1CL23_HOLLE|nr:hypothetical protein HOLleu_05468 [Holothuria leucospilota]
MSVSELVNDYNTKMRAVIDEVAPLLKNSYLDKPRAPWFGADHLQKRRQLRKLERKYLSTGLSVHREMFKTARNKYRSDLNDAYASYHRERISEADQKTMFRIVDSIIGKRNSIARIIPKNIDTAMKTRPQPPSPRLRLVSRFETDIGTSCTDDKENRFKSHP